MENRFFTSSTEPLDLSNNDCLILVFADEHKTSSPIKLIKSVSHYLRQKMDEPITYAFETTLRTKDLCFQNYSDLVDASIVEVRNLLEEINTHKNLISDFNTLKIDNEDPDIISLVNEKITISETEINTLQTNLDDKMAEIDVYNEKAKFISQLESLKMGFSSLDVSDKELNIDELDYKEKLSRLTSEETIELRDKYMVDKILPLLAKNKILIVHIGELHIRSIIEKLIEKGVNPVNITGYIIANPTILDRTNKLSLLYASLKLEGEIGQEDLNRKLYRLFPLNLSLNIAGEQKSPITPVNLSDNDDESTFAQAAKNIVDDALHMLQKLKNTKY